MKRFERVQQALAKLSAERGVTAGELAENLGLSRANVSSDLNFLCKEGKAFKTGSKPVYYRISEAAVRQKSDSILDTFVRNNRSLFHCVEQAKAAVVPAARNAHDAFRRNRRRQVHVCRTDFQICAAERVPY